MAASWVSFIDLIHPRTAVSETCLESLVMMVFSGRIFSTIFRAITCRETGVCVGGCVILALFHYRGQLVMVGREGKLAVPPPNRNCMSVDKGPTWQSCKISQRHCKVQSLFRILMWEEYVGQCLVFHWKHPVVFGLFESLTIFSSKSLTSYFQCMSAGAESAAGLLNVIGMII